MSVFDPAAPPCRLCGVINAGLIGTKSGRFRPVQFSFYRCRACGYRFVSPVLGDAVYDQAYYEGRGADPLVNYQREYEDYRRTERLFELEDLVEIAKRHFSEQRPFTASNLSWLDFGCGAGSLLKFVRDLNCLEIGTKAIPVEISGFDVGVFARRLAVQDGFKIWDLEELNRLPEQTFDVISCVEVVEHLEHPMEVFKLLAKLLRKDGLLLLTTGNLESPLARLLGIHFPYCTPEIHVGYFYPALLERAYHQVGLTPKCVRFKGALQFKILKNLPSFIPAKLKARLACVRILQQILDFGFGVSQMPCATK